MGAKRGKKEKLLLALGGAYLGIGLILATWAASTWPETGVHGPPVLVFLRNMLLWPLWLPATVAMGRGSSH